MPTLKMTAKRQVTFPAQVCKDLGLQPGALLNLEKRTIEDQPVWVLRPRKANISWFGSLKKYATNENHDLEDIRNSIGQAIGKKHE